MGRSKSVGMYIPIIRSNATPSSSCKDHEASKHNTSAQLFLCNPGEAFSCLAILDLLPILLGKGIVTMVAYSCRDQFEVVRDD